MAQRSLMNLLKYSQVSATQQMQPSHLHALDSALHMLLTSEEMNQEKRSLKRSQKMEWIHDSFERTKASSRTIITFSGTMRSAQYLSSTKHMSTTFRKLEPRSGYTSAPSVITPFPTTKKSLRTLRHT